MVFILGALCVHQMFLTLHGHRLFIQTEGKGFPVVLLHHGLGSSAAWRRQIPPLVGAGYRVIAYDRWGYGRSEERERLHVPDFAPDVDDLQALLDHFGIEKAALVGHSDGGTIALYCAAQCKRRVAALITLAAHVYVEPKMHVGMEALLREYEQSEKFRAALNRVHNGRGAQVFRMWYEGWHNPAVLSWDARPKLREIAAPALVVQGTDDEYATPKHAADIAAAIPNAELLLLQGEKHMALNEQFTSKTVNFLQKHLANPHANL